MCIQPRIQSGLRNTMSEKGLCVDCGLKSDRFCLLNPCKHEICQTCLAKKTDFEVCSGCNGKVQFLSCPGKKDGCPFTAAPESWKDHLDKCFYVPVECPYRCEALVPKRAVLSHMTTLCPLRVATCKFCAEAVYQVEVTSHEESCPEAPVTCPYCLLEGIKMKELPTHTEGCPKAPRPCPLEKFGCDFTGMGSDMDEHLVLKTHVVCFEKLTEKLQQSQDEITRLRDDVVSCKAQLDTCKRVLDFRKTQLEQAMYRPQGLNCCLL